jgi:hypothetical protein
MQEQPIKCQSDKGNSIQNIINPTSKDLGLDVRSANSREVGLCYWLWYGITVLAKAILAANKLSDWWIGQNLKSHSK